MDRYIKAYTPYLNFLSIFLGQKTRAKNLQKTLQNRKGDIPIPYRFGTLGACNIVLYTVIYLHENIRNARVTHREVLAH